MTVVEFGPHNRRAGKRSRGYFGMAVWHPKSEVNIGTLWRTAFLYDAAFIATVGRRYQKQASDTPGVGNHVPLMHYSDLDDLIDHLPNSCPLIGIELDDRARPLTEFCHPQRGLYLLGAEDHGLPESVLDRLRHWADKWEAEDRAAAERFELVPQLTNDIVTYFTGYTSLQDAMFRANQTAEHLVDAGWTKAADK